MLTEFAQVADQHVAQPADIRQGRPLVGGGDLGETFRSSTAACALSRSHSTGRAASDAASAAAS